MLITSDQSRAGRALARITRAELAVAAGVTERTLADFERRTRDAEGAVRVPRRSTLIALQAALESAGVLLVDEIPDAGLGVRFKERRPASTDKARSAPDTA